MPRKWLPVNYGHGKRQYSNTFLKIHCREKKHSTVDKAKRKNVKIKLGPNDENCMYGDKAGNNTKENRKR